MNRTLEEFSNLKEDEKERILRELSENIITKEILRIISTDVHSSTKINDYKRINRRSKRRNLKVKLEYLISNGIIRFTNLQKTTFETTKEIANLINEILFMKDEDLPELIREINS